MKKLFILLLCITMILNSALILFGCNIDSKNKENMVFKTETELSNLAPKLGKGTNYYFSVSGNDMNDGLSPQTPKKSLSAISKLKLVGGDNILLKSGDVFTNTLSLKTNITGEDVVTISSYGEEGRAKIKTNYNCIVMNNCSGYRISNLELELTNGSYAGEGALSVGIYVKSSLDSQPMSRIYIENNIIYGIDENRNTRGIYFEGIYNKTGEPDTRCIVSDCCVVNNDISNIGMVGVSFSVWDSLTNDNASATDNYFNNIRIAGNKIENVGIIGAYLQNTTNGEITRNYIDKAGAMTQKNLNWGPVGIMCLIAKNIKISENVTVNTLDAKTTYDGAGIDIDWSSQNVLVENNFSADNYGGGIVTMACADSEIKGNLIRDNGCKTIAGKGNINLGDYSADYRLNDYFPTQECIRGVNNMSCTNNLIVASHEGTAAVSTSLYDTKAVDEHWWKNNIFANNSVVLRSGTVAARLHEDCGFDVFDNNAYSIEKDFKSSVYAAKPGDRYNLTYTNYNNFEEWKEFAYYEKKYDENSNVTKYSDKKSENKLNFDLKYENEELTVTINSDFSDLFYYVVYIDTDKDHDFTDGYHFSKEKNYKHRFEYAGVYYVGVEAFLKNGSSEKSVETELHLIAKNRG